MVQRRRDPVFGGLRKRKWSREEEIKAEERIKVTILKFIIHFSYHASSNLWTAIPNLRLSGRNELMNRKQVTFVETVSRGSASCLNVPLTLAECLKPKIVGNFRSVHGIG